jgi:hypothetical protein
MLSHPYIFGAVPGGDIPVEGISDSTQAPVYYIGWTTDNVNYVITRITRNIDNTISTAEAVGAWADRYTLNYQ